MPRQATVAVMLAALCALSGCAGREVVSSVSPDGRCRVTVRHWSSNPFSLDPGALIEGRCGWRGYEILKMDDWPVYQGEFEWSPDSKRVGIIICYRKELGFDFERGTRSDRVPETRLAAERIRKRGSTNKKRARDCW